MHITMIEYSYGALHPIYPAFGKWHHVQNNPISHIYDTINALIVLIFTLMHKRKSMIMQTCPFLAFITIFMSIHCLSSYVNAPC